MKTKLIQIIEQDGHSFGQVSNPADLTDTQKYLHDRISELTRDFLNNQKAHEAVGFSYSLGAGNAFNITIAAPGRIYETDGKSFELPSNTTLAIAASDDEFPRLDVVVAILESDVDAATALIPFVRLRTSAEFSGGAAAFPPQNISVATEKHNRAVVQIKTGSAAADAPALPALASNEVPLYLIAVAPGASKIRDEDVRDLRENPLTLRKLSDLTGQNKIDLAILRELVERNADIGSLIVAGRLLGSRTLRDILQSFQNQLNTSRELPEIRFDNPKVSLTDPTSSKIMASGAVVGGVPVVNVEIGGKINFGDADVILNPDKFPAEMNARFEHLVSSPAIDSNEYALTLNSITQTESDGSLDFAAKSAEFTAPRARPGCAARNEQFIEIFGGLAQNNTSALSEWLTYDIENDTLTPRTPNVQLPGADRPAAMSCGDGTNVLYIAGNSTNQTPSVFKINAATGAVTTIATTKPTGYQFFGDLIAPGKIFVVAISNDGGDSRHYVTEFWEFDTATNQFTELGVTGNIPVCQLDYASGCFFQENKFVLVNFTPGESESGNTYTFNRTNLQWSRANIAQPFGDTADKQSPLRLFQMANVNGRPVLVGGLLTKDTDKTKAKLWELRLSSGQNQIKTLKWEATTANFTPIQDGGLCSALNAGMPQGKAFLIAGQDSFSKAQQRIYASVQGGIIATVYRGEPGISIADSSTYAQFVIPVYETDWDVKGYRLSFRGEEFNAKNLKIEVSLDGGAHFIDIQPDTYIDIADSSAPGQRLLRITLYNVQSSKPVLSKLFEVFDQDGVELEDRIVIRYDAPATLTGLYVDRNGTVVLLPVIEPSTPDKCLLHRITPAGASAPLIKNYINRRRPHIKYSETDTGTSGDLTFENELAVPVRYINSRAYDADGKYYFIPDPPTDFDSIVSVSVESTGDTWIVELEG